MDNEEQKSLGLIEYFLQNPCDLNKLSRADCKDVLRLASMTADDTQDVRIKGRCYDLLYECCFRMELDIKELWHIYCILHHRMFQNAKIPFGGHLDELYRMIFLKIKNALPDLNAYTPYESTSQLIVKFIAMLLKFFLDIQRYISSG